jgi:23S rRNA G2445 N2-methylase RlmL
MPQYEIEAIPGLEEIVVAELRDRRFAGVRVIGTRQDGRVVVDVARGDRQLAQLRTASAVYLIVPFAVPRPQALLGHEHFTRLVAAIRGVIAANAPTAFRTFRVSAAGADSPAFVRLRAALGAELALEATTQPAPLQLAVRRPIDGGSGWEVLIRTTPAPLASRSWRVCNYPGALNASIAAAMARLAAPAPTDRYLNVCCGSATLLIEQLALAPTRLAIGVDIAPAALACARQNLAASGYAQQVQLVEADARKLPLDDRSIHRIVADLPFGQLLETDQNVDALYVGVVREAARMVVPEGRFVAITTRKKSFDRALDLNRSAWIVERTLTLKVPFQSGYIQPRIYVLRRKN